MSLLKSQIQKRVSLKINKKYFGWSKTFIKISKTVANKECAKKERA